MPITSYKDLTVWQKSMKLVICIYELTKEFPKEEIFGLSSQMRRCVISIPSNIAEGSRRSSKKDFRNFILTAYGSGAELETQIEIAKQLSYGNSSHYEQIDILLDQIMRMLNSFEKKLS